MSGAEPIRNLEAWNKNSSLKETHNCFTYSMNVIDKKLIQKCDETEDCDVGFHQPGYASGYGQFPEKHKKGCIDMVSRMWGDNPDVRSIKYHQRCPEGTSKIALIVDPKRDYHFLRQDKVQDSHENGTWSHKPGSMNVTTEDASGRPIIRPDRALFIYKDSKDRKDHLEYTKFCGYYCVPRGKPLYLMSDARIEGGAKLAKTSSSSFPRPSRYQQTRRKSRGGSR
uniref:Uncharacterized protein n=1 Tax=viral metagenome TaxID=1070528 RepID=A0A6C0AMS0_9ZZZZ